MVASLHREKRHGRTYYRIQFYDKNNTRRSIRLKGVNAKSAENIRVRVTELVSASIGGTPLERQTGLWLRDIGQDLADKLAGVGLIEPRQPAKLGPFVGEYIESRSDTSEYNRRNWRVTRDKLVDHFGENRDMRSVKPGECDEWRQALVNAGLSEPTVGKHVKHARHFFLQAKRRGLIDRNPFDGVRGGSQMNRDRLEFIDQARTQKIIDAAPDDEWKLIIALARYGGLRTPSETLALRWNHIDWERERITVPSSKTAKKGKPCRVIPLFLELRPYLERALMSPEGAEYVIQRYRDPSVNLRSQLLRIVRKAGVEPWERPFHNLRASRQTELSDTFPAHVVSEWLGNTVDVARGHYLSVHDAHFQRALEPGNGGATGGAMVVQQVVPTADADKCHDEPKHRENEGETQMSGLFPTFAELPEHAREDSNECRETRGKGHKSGTGGARGGAVGDQCGDPEPSADADLQAVIDAWPGLPTEARGRILDIVLRNAAR